MAWVLMAMELTPIMSTSWLLTFLSEEL